ncbi:MAG: tetraacyldisaccharide 4'-kinase [Candidatus Eisenbacteria bacterium]|nr:tetraacyldisaccharide 4'-kinase [Candidatus Eisenbacteria bacterium]
MQYIEQHERHAWLRVAASPLLALSWVYEVGLNLRWILQELRNKASVPCPVVSVGNMTVGGTGKTPTVAWVAEFLVRNGIRIAIVSHGYGGGGRFVLLRDQVPRADIAAMAGDEAVLLSHTLPGVPVASGRRKARVLLRAWRRLRPDVIVIDDGFQSISIRRDLDVVAVDATNPWGSGHLLPRGRLREKRENLSRADVVVLTRCNQCGDFSLLVEEIKTLTDAPIVKADHVVRGVRKLDTDAQAEPKVLAGAGVYAFSAIANPASFERTLQDAGASLVGVRRFSDHHFFSAEDLAEVESEAVFARAKFLVTTEKDAMRLPSAWTLNRGIPLLAVGISLSVTEGREILESLLLGLFSRRAN